MQIESFCNSFLSDQNLVGQEIEKAISWLRVCGLCQTVLADAEIVLAEAVNNIVEHAYLYRTDGSIELRLCKDAETLTIELKDSGEKLLSVPQKKVMHGNAVAFEDLPEGGFGWFLIHSLTSGIEYQFVGDQNVLKLQMPVVQ